MSLWTWWKKQSVYKPTPIDSTLTDEVQLLCQVLRELISILQADGEELWQAWMTSSLAALEANDLSGIHDLLKSYGGMGSFNDLIVGQRSNGDGFYWAPNAAETNDRLNALRTQAYELSQTILMHMQALQSES